MCVGITRESMSRGDELAGDARAINLYGKS